MHSLAQTNKKIFFWLGNMKRLRRCRHGDLAIERGRREAATNVICLHVTPGCADHLRQINETHGGASMGSTDGDRTSRRRGATHVGDTSSRLWLADAMETHFTEPLES